MSSFDQLHPALQHHIVNSLGWQSLRPLQEQAIAPLLAGEHALLIAPTAGGKTEAAYFPIASRILTGDWRGLSVLYVCPLRALLNNLEVRLQRYGHLIGRRVGLWHGDVGESARRSILSDPPDVLLITPESLEVILVSRKWDKRRLFAGVRAVIVDEIHAFAGDDRGWHLLAVLQRITRLAGREIQRVGLSATVGNPDALLGWLVGSCDGPRRVISPAGEATKKTDVGLDYVGSLENAATVLSRLHRGEKRLVFCDSRSQVEELTASLRKRGVETYVSHSSLGVDERRRAEEAFAGGNDCVIVATSTLELGIDVGDLDRVIQIGAPWSVASFLQRLGRTGRRTGSTRNCLFLPTSEDTFLRAAGIINLWARGFVEPIEPPPAPFHILAQQIMALALQEGGIGVETWKKWVGSMPGFAALPQDEIDLVVAYMVETGILWNDNGILWFGREGEKTFGRRHFMELLSSFTSSPLIAIRYGRAHLGSVDAASFTMRHDEAPVLLLAGRSWVVTHIDWNDRIAYAEPSEKEGRSRWIGDGQPLSFDLCRSICDVIAGKEDPVGLSKRGREQLTETREAFAWLHSQGTTVVRDAKRTAWWTFAGLKANAALTAALRAHGLPSQRPTNFSISMEESVPLRELERRLAAVLEVDPRGIEASVEPKAIDDLKFSQCLPRQIAADLLRKRNGDPRAVEWLAHAQRHQVDLSAGD